MQYSRSRTVVVFSKSAMMNSAKFFPKKTQPSCQSQSCASAGLPASSSSSASRSSSVAAQAPASATSTAAEVDTALQPLDLGRHVTRVALRSDTCASRKQPLAEARPPKAVLRPLGS